MVRYHLKEALLKSKSTPQQPLQQTATKETVAPNTATLRRLLEQMLLIRRFEERAGQLYGQGHIGGFCHLYIGQEAIAVGAVEAKQEQDTFVTAYRDHGHMLATGMDPKRVMAELTGRFEGSSKGKGGSMHMFDPEKGFLGGHGIVGAQVPLGTGVAFAHKYKEDDGVCLTFMGDGAANQGQVYESFNMASLWNLPVIYVIENNGYGMGTSTKRACARSEDLWRRGEPFGIWGEKVDGMDIIAVISAFERALKTARKGHPVLLEMTTYRYRGHSMSDPALYRSKEEVDDVKTNNDPITLLQQRLATEHKVPADELKALDTRAKDIVKEAVAFAKDAPLPPESELYTDILRDGEGQ